MVSVNRLVGRGALLLACVYAVWAAAAADEAWREAFAGRVHAAWAAGAPMPQLSAAHPEAGLADAYAIQAQFVEALCGGAPIGGFKAAIVGAAGQRNLGLDGPLVAVLPKDGILRAADGVTIDLADDPRRHVETEIGYIFSARIDAPVADVDALKARVERVAPVLEVPGNAVEDAGPATAADLVAWNINGKAIVVGAPKDPAELDMDANPNALAHNGQVVNTAQSGDAAGGQWATLLAAVNTLVELGYAIEPGQVIANGALGQIVRAEPGSYRGDFGPLGTVSFDVVDTRTP